MDDAGGFDHNANTIRMLTRLESPYPRFAGLNLSWETLEGLAKHNGPVERSGRAVPWALAEADQDFPLELGTWPGLEAQVAAIADDIAYDNHDIDDGLRAGLFTLEEVLAVPLTAARWDSVIQRHQDVDRDRLVPELIRDQIGWMVNDVLAETRRRIASSRVESADDVRRAGASLAGFSEPLRSEERTLKAFLYARMYDAPAVKAVKDRAQQVLAGLFAAYRDDPGRLPEQWRPQTADRTIVARTIGDFIAGMTDRYAIRCYEDLIGPADLPEGF